MLDRPPARRARVCSMSARTNGWAPLPRPRLDTATRRGVARPDRHQQPSKRGVGESASSTPAQHWRGKARRQVAGWLGPCGARGVAWRNQPMGAPNCTPAARTPQVRPSVGVCPPPPSHTRANVRQACTLHPHPGRVGWQGALVPPGVVTNKQQSRHPCPCKEKTKGCDLSRPRHSKSSHSGRKGAGSTAFVQH